MQRLEKEKEFIHFLCSCVNCGTFFALVTVNWLAYTKDNGGSGRGRREQGYSMEGSRVNAKREREVEIALCLYVTLVAIGAKSISNNTQQEARTRVKKRPERQVNLLFSSGPLRRRRQINWNTFLSTCTLFFLSFLLFSFSLCLSPYLFSLLAPLSFSFPLSTALHLHP